MLNEDFALYDNIADAQVATLNLQLSVCRLGTPKIICDCMLRRLTEIVGSTATTSMTLLTIRVLGFRVTVARMPSNIFNGTCSNEVTATGLVTADMEGT